MDDQIRRLMTNQTTFDRFQRPVEVSQASLMPLGIAQCHSAIDTDIPGVITMHILVFTVPSFIGAKTRFCIDNRVIRTANQAGLSPNCLRVPRGAYRCPDVDIRGEKTRLGVPRDPKTAIFTPAQPVFRQSTGNQRSNQAGNLFRNVGSG